MSCSPSPCNTGNNPCPQYPDAKCVVYTGPALPCMGAVTNTRLDIILQKIDTKLCNTVTTGNDLTYHTSDFSSPTECLDPNLMNKRYRLAWRGIGKLDKDVEWEPIHAGGFRILIPGFDVTLDDGNLFFVEFY